MASGFQYQNRSEQLLTELGDVRGLVIVLAYESFSALIHQDVGAASEFADQALALVRQANMEVGSSAETAKTLVLLAQGELDAARISWEHALHRPRQEIIDVLCAFYGLAGVAAAEGRFWRALRLEGAADALREKWSLHPPPIGSPLDRVLKRPVNPAREALGDAAQAEAAAQGRQMAEDEAIEYALSDRD